MMRRIIWISLLAFGAGLAVQLIFCGLYVSSIINDVKLLDWLLITCYVVSERLLLGTLLFFMVAVPVGSILLQWLKQKEPLIYPAIPLGIAILITGLMGKWTDGFDWQLLFFLMSATFFFGGFWWNRIEGEHMTS
ncbi:hypothetical protein [Marininema halotolerans]|uniref:Uncharacterized protein n=1 Tax=Marininema halotolerans TaxID=1155944 RepID=A0A1I6PM17_9BACL|nr:hypothetical protein [Marininema halotolerans]SFS41229.1 hypothetical protein SAMN05444972_1027 [Marininema halotolerans]